MDVWTQKLLRMVSNWASFCGIPMPAFIQLTQKRKEKNRKKAIKDKTPKLRWKKDRN